MKSLFNLLFIPIILLLASCAAKSIEEAHNEDGVINISKAQFEAEKMQVGEPEPVLMKEMIPFTGKIISAIDGIVKINAPMEGVVKKIYVQNGTQVSKNQVLLEIGGNAVIDLQKSYALSNTKIKQLEANYKRAKSLYEDNIKTENEFMVAESDYHSELANYNALKIKMGNAGLSSSDIQKGKYVSSYQIKAAIAGRIGQMNVVVGQYINRETEIMEIVDKNKVELKLDLYEKDYAKIKSGQKVVFGNMENGNDEVNAIISRIENQLNSNSNSFACYAQIDKDSAESFVVNQIVTGQVIVAADSVIAIPQTAVFKIEGKHFIVVQTQSLGGDYSFETREIRIGRSDDNYVEIMDVPKNAKILLSGTYNLSME